MELRSFLMGLNPVLLNTTWLWTTDFNCHGPYLYKWVSSEPGCPV